MSNQRSNDENESSPVPLFGTWRKAYLVVVAVFVFDVVAFYAISRYFS